MPALAWTVLGLVFVDELAVIAAAGVVGSRTGPTWLCVWLLPILAVVTWWSFASPKAPLGGPVARPLAKVLVFGASSLGLWLVGLPGWAIALVTFSVMVNLVAQAPFVRAVLPAGGDEG